jgi:hypothetical protein
VALSAIANVVDDSLSTTRGAFTQGWWRTPAEPYNARTSELVHTLSWFAANRRPWNSYFGDEELLARLDAALGRYLDLQHPNGSWPEYSPSDESPAATAFALGYLTKTLANLRSVDALPARHGQIVESVRRGVRWVLHPDNPEVWRPDVIEFSNQVLAALSGAAQALHQDPDAELSALLADRISFAARRIQSPAGFFYESGGMDLGYNLAVSLAEIAELHRTLDATPLLPQVWALADWLGHAMVPEPDGAGLIGFDTASTRTPMAYLNAATTDGDPRDLGALLALDVPTLRPFYTAREERARQRHAWASAAVPISGVEPGRANPRVVANVDLPEPYPEAAARSAAISRMPAVDRDHFTELRRDGQQDYLFVRRPTSYVQAFFGARPTSRTRTGLALLWHPRAGTFIHAGQEDSAAWGVALDDGRSETEAWLFPEYYDDHGAPRRLLAPQAVAGAQQLRLSWSAFDEEVLSSVTWVDDTLLRSVTVSSTATEQVPLLVRLGDGVTWGDGSPVGSLSHESATTTGLSITRGGTIMTISWGRPLEATVTATDRTYFENRSRRTHALRIRFSGSVSLRYRFDDASRPQSSPSP